PAQIAASTATGGDGSTYTYSWLNSTTSATAGFSAIVSTNVQNYTPGVLTQNTWFRRRVVSGVCNADTTTALLVTVTNAIATNTISGAPQSICSGSSPAQIAASTATGGDGSTYTYSWLNSTTSATAGFSAIVSTNVQNYTPGVLTQNTWFRRRVVSGVCNADTTTALLVTVTNAIATNTISGAPQSICSGSSPAQIAASTATGGDGSTYTYSWLNSTTSATAGFSAIVSTNVQNYTPGVLTQNTWFRRRVVSGACNADTTSALLVTVNSAVATNTISGAPQTICSGSAPAQITASTPTGGDGTTYTYSWLSSITSATAGFSAIASTNVQNYTPGVLTQNTWFRRTVTSGVCNTDTTTALKVTISNAVATNTITGATQTICSGSSPAQITASTPTGGDGTTYTYSWLSSTTSATAGFSAIASTNVQNYTPVVLTQNTWFRRRVVSGACSADTTSALLVTVNSAVATNTITGTPQTICSGSSSAQINAAVATGGDGSTYTYSWLSSTTSATAGFSAIGSTNTQNYSPGVLTQNSWFRRKVTSGVCNADTTAALMITVTPSIVGNTIATNQSILISTAPTPLTGSTPTGGNGTFTYSWLVSTVSGTSGFSAISSTNTTGYSPGVLTVTTWYRRLVISGSCSDTSAAVSISVNANLANNTISAAQTICSGSTPTGLTGLLPVGGTGIFTYTWLQSTTSATAGFSAISSSNTQNYSPGALTQSTWFRRYVVSGVASDTSVALKITVTNAVATNTITGTTQSVCNGSAPAQITASTPTGGDGTTYTFSWLSSTTSATAGFSAIASTNVQNYSPGIMTQNTWFRRRVVSGACNADTTSALLVSVTNAVATNTITGSTQTICSGSAPAQITASTPTGGDGTTYTFSWLSSTTNATAGFSAIASTNVQNYTPSALTQNTWFRRRVVSGACNADTTTALLVTVNNAIATNTISGAPQSICSGSSPAQIAASTATGGDGSTYTYSWLSSTTSATAGFSVIASTNVQNYTPGVLTQNTWFRRRVVSGVCNADTTTALLVTVTNAIATNTISGAPQSICSGSSPAQIAASTATGGDGSTYTYSWLNSTTSATAGFSAIVSTNVQNYTPGVLTQNTWFRRRVVSGVCNADTTTALLVTVTNALATNTISGLPQTICNGSTPAQINASTATGGDGSTYTYSWLNSTTSATAGFSAIASTNVQNYTPGALTQNTWFRRRVVSGVCNADTTAAILITVNNTNTWSGVSTTAWGTTTNWGCGRVPLATDSVVIVSASNQPIIIDGGRVSNSLTINSGATLTLNNTASLLTIGNIFTNNGTLTHSAGEIVFGGSAPQTIPAGTYNKLTLNNASGILLGGNITLNDSLKMSNGNLVLNNSNVTLAGTTGIISNANATRYIITNSNGGFVQIQNIGTGGRTGAVAFPIGNGSYNPVSVTNIGTSDQFNVRVIDSVTNNYTGNIPTGAKLLANAVNRTWIVNEAVVGGGNATVTVQWNSTDEMSGFTRATSYLARYSGTTWMSNTATSATGANPYTQTRTGLTTFSAFGVGSNGTLPVTLINFAGVKNGKVVDLSWTTVSELNNDHFTIERSTDGVNFEFVANVKGHGTTALVNNYTDIDNVSDLMSQHVSTVYYKLIQVDVDGQSTESGMIAVNIATTVNGLSMNARPNPFSDKLHVSITSSKDQSIAIRVTDIAGKLIAEQSEQILSGSNEFELKNIDGLKPGMYFVQMISDEGVITEKVLRQN
ncbi:MAG: T9SS type A sorting domain-containing protein, partial [Bacteroidota bacterium]